MDLIDAAYGGAVADLDLAALFERFRERAEAVRSRNLPPVAGPERTKFIEQAETDFQDFAIIGDAEGEIIDGILTMRVDLRPADTEANDD